MAVLIGVLGGAGELKSRRGERLFAAAWRRKHCCHAWRTGRTLCATDNLALSWLRIWADFIPGSVARALFARSTNSPHYGPRITGHSMSDIQNAAVLLMSLPEEEASVLLSKLDPKQVEQVSIQIARTNSVSGDDQQRVMQEFTESNPALGGRGGGLELAKSLVQKALGSNAGAALNNIRQSIEAMPFGFLRHIDSQNILTYIVDEHPQTIALIMSHLPASAGAEILAGLPESRRLAVVRRIATMGQTNPEIIREVEKGLERRMSSVMSQSFEHAGGVDAVAAMLNVSDRATERTLMDSLAQEDPELVDEIRRLMFVFEDIARFSDKDIQNVLKNVETNQWALALKGASDGLREKILKNMSERAAEMLREEMEYLGPVKRSAVEGKQQEIVDIIRQLEDNGEIDINASDEEEELVQ